jgi:hypothetical protein
MSALAFQCRGRLPNDSKSTKPCPAVFSFRDHSTTHTCVLCNGEVFIRRRPDGEDEVVTVALTDRMASSINDMWLQIAFRCMCGRVLIRSVMTCRESACAGCDASFRIDQSEGPGLFEVKCTEPGRNPYIVTLDRNVPRTPAGHGLEQKRRSAL